MKKKVREGQKLAILSLLAILLVELMLLSEFTGFAVFKTVGEDNKESVFGISTCVPQTEICDGKDNNCNGAIDENNVCNEVESQPEFDGYIVELKDEPLATYKVSQEKFGVSTASISTYRNNLIKKQNEIELQIKNLAPSTVIINKVQNVFNGFSVRGISKEEIQQIENLPGVKKVYPNYKVHTTLTYSAPLIGADKVWNIQINGTNITGRGIKIGIIDTGVDYTHPDLGGCFGPGCKVEGGWDFQNNDGDPIDDMGHGTHVASIAAGGDYNKTDGIIETGDPLNGVAPGAKIYAYKVLDNNGEGYFSNVIAAIERSADPNQDGDFSDHLDVISISLGGYGDPDDPTSQAVDNIVNSDVVAVVAAGNSGPDGNNYCRHSEDETGSSYSICSPGTARKAITVAASSKDDRIAEFGSIGPTTLETFKPDISAPGVFICAARYDSVWEYARCFIGDDSDTHHIALSGTSMATPHVSGTIALIKQAHPTWTPDEIKNSIKGTSVNLNASASQEGSGRLNALSTVLLSNPIDYWDMGLFPLQGIFDNHSIIEIKGIFPENYSSLILEYTQEEVENWSNKGVTLVEEGNLIATFDSSFIKERGSYKFRLTVTKENLTKQDSIKIYFNGDLRPGWPLKVDNVSHISIKKINVADLDNDGKKEIIVGINGLKEGIWDGLIYVFRENGSIFSENWPMRLGSSVNNPVVADLNKDGFKEIIVGETDIYAISYFPNGRMHVLSLNGTELNGWPVLLNGSLTSEMGSSVGDIDGDGELEIVSPTGGSFSDQYGTITLYNKVYAFHSNGSLVRGWPVETIKPRYPYDAPPVLADLNNDSSLEVIIGAISLNVFTGVPLGGGGIFAFYGNGTLLNGFPYRNDDWNWAIAAADLNNDGNIEILTHDEIIDSHGNLVRRFKESVFSTLSVADLNKDGNLEIVYGTSDGYLRARDYYGNLLRGWENIFFLGTFYDGNPIIGDIDNDGYFEVLIGSSQDNKIYAFNHDGSIAKGFPILIGAYNSELADLDNNGNIELITSTSEVGIHAWNLNTPYDSEKMPWPKFQHDSQHTGFYNRMFVCADVNLDGKVSSGDVIYLVNYIFKAGPAPNPIWTGNVNNDTIINSADVIYLVNYIFKGGPTPMCSGGNPTTQKTYTQTQLQSIENQLKAAGITIDITPEITPKKIVPGASSNIN